MQPYLFPYIGYFQLMNLADTFVVYDDVQYIKGGWINRNNILVSGERKLFNLSLKNDSTFSNINERFFDVAKFEREKIKLLKTISQSYSKATYFKEAYSLIESILSNSEIQLSEFIIKSIVKINEYLQIDTAILKSSEIEFDKRLKAQERVINLCENLKAQHYINPIGGIELYSKGKFQESGIILNFIKTNEIIYKQFSDNFISNLSIIDVMMFNSPETINKMLNQYELV